MFNESEYLTGWLIYLAGATGAMVVWWYMTRKIPQKILRDLLRITVLVVAVTPWTVSNELSYLAPAAMITMVEGFLTEEGTFTRGGIPILVALALSYAFYFVLYFLWRHFGLKRQQKNAQEQSLMAGHDDLLAESQAQQDSALRAER